MKHSLSRLTIKSFHIEDIVLSNATSVNGSKLTINKNININSSNISKCYVSVIDNKDMKVNSIMDVIPISTKVHGKLGQGITHTLTGVSVILTGHDEVENQFKNFGCSAGILSQQMKFNQAGTPSNNDLLILVNVTTKKNTCDDRNVVQEVHQCCDDWIQGIRDTLKKIDGNKCDELHTFEDNFNAKNKKVMLIKQLGGQGVMHDSIILPTEPSGISGGNSMMYYKNMPVLLTPNEYRDGAIKAMT